MRLHWTRLAIGDLDSVYEYIAGGDPEAAQRLIERIESAASILIRHPFAGRSGRVHGTHELIVPGTPYIVFYRLHRGLAQVLTVLHASRKWPESL